ncbi:tail length tape measure protein [Thermoanaerobacterium thermosaccharolyticum]|uniref:Tail length tape measure protein n=1 Tax=Thermoanaerobacterium thermosaccharolyticum TaxID=1517 RepID=A0A223HWB4_THETR|nr:tail length tape measure protein [Thermoanaerobacterium thermosaccharolyticum]
MRCMLFLKSSTLAITHLEMFAPAFFQASPHCVMMSWFSSIHVVSFSSPGFMPSHRPCPQGLKSEFWRVSLRVDNIPFAVLDWLAIIPPKRFSMPRNNASITFAASMLSLPMFAICSPVRPSSSCRIWLAGTPSSWSCKSSSACARPLARIWPRALVILSISSEPAPKPLAVSPMVFSISSTLSASNPKAIKSLLLLISSGNSNGVLFANSDASFRNCWAFSALFSMVSNAICVCSKSAAMSIGL